MLRLALKEAKKIGLDRVLLTVDSDKTASIATMKKNGAVLENEVPYLGKITQRYWIELWDDLFPGDLIRKGML